MYRWQWRKHQYIVKPLFEIRDTEVLMWELKPMAFSLNTPCPSFVFLSMKNGSAYCTCQPYENICTLFSFKNIIEITSYTYTCGRNACQQMLLRIFPSVYSIFNLSLIKLKWKKKRTHKLSTSMLLGRANKKHLQKILYNFKYEIFSSPKRNCEELIRASPKDTL